MASIVVVTALAGLAACGSGDSEDGSPASTPSVTVSAPAGTTATPPTTMPGPASPADPAALVARIQQMTPAIVAAFDGDEDAALRAALLASDAGYTPIQILPAAMSGRLQPDGTVVGDDGGAVAPDTPAQGLLVESAGVSASSPQSRVPVARVVGDLRTASANAGLPPLVMYFALLTWGYNIDQIVEHTLTGSITRDLEVADADGAPVPPADPAWPLSGPPEPTADTVLDPAGVELIARAVGDYELVTEDLSVDLINAPGVIGVEETRGTLVIGPDGTISGSFGFVLISGDSQYRLESRLVFTVASAPLRVVDDGLRFTAQTRFTMTQYGLGADGDQTTSPWGPVEGYVDVDLGQVVLDMSVAEGVAGPVRFER